MGNESVSAELMAGLLAGEWEPGALVSEADVVERCGAGPTPARKALLHWTADGFVETGGSRRRRITLLDGRQVLRLADLVCVLAGSATVAAGFAATEAELCALADRLLGVADALEDRSPSLRSGIVGYLDALGATSRRGQLAAELSLATRRLTGLMVQPLDTEDRSGDPRRLRRVAEMLRSGHTEEAALEGTAVIRAMVDRRRPTQDEIYRLRHLPTFDGPFRWADSSLSRRIAEQVRADIVAGVLKPGDLIPEDQLARRYLVSPTPVREALMLLSSDGLVDLSARRARTVSRLGPRQAAELIEVLQTVLTASAAQSLPVMPADTYARLAPAFRAAGAAYRKRGADYARLSVRAFSLLLPSGRDDEAWPFVSRMVHRVTLRRSVLRASAVQPVVGAFDGLAQVPFDDRLDAFPARLRGLFGSLAAAYT